MMMETYRRRWPRVLVIENDMDEAGSLSMLLQLCGHTVEVAPDGLTAMELAHAFIPDVVLCEIALPGMDGFHVAAAMRADPVLTGTRLIALSTDARPEDVRRTHEAGFSAHLLKPANPDELIRILRHA